MTSRMEGIMLLKTKFLLAKAWPWALRKSYLKCSLFLAALKKQTFHLLWLLSQSPLYWAKDIFQAHMFRFFPIGFWFYPESHMWERGTSQSPDYRGMYFWAFAPGAAHSFMPVSPWLVPQDEDSAWDAEHPCSKGNRRRHTIGYQHTRFSYAFRSCFGQGLPCLAINEALLPLFHIISNQNHNPKAKGCDI